MSKNTEERINCAYLLADELHTLEYYLKQIEEFDESDFTIEVLRDGGHGTRHC